MDEKIAAVLEKFPFLSYGTLHDSHYIGIVQNCDTQLISIYDLNVIPNEELRQDFLKCGENWWWESNRQIPINIFLKERFLAYRPFLKHFARKDFVLVAGPPIVSLQDIIARRVRKRQVTLIRRFE